MVIAAKPPVGRNGVHKTAAPKSPEFAPGPETKKVPIGMIEEASYNHPARTSNGAKHLHSLQYSLERVGQLSPVQLSLTDHAERLRTVDGHRRIAAAKMLGWELIWAIIVPAELACVHYAEGNNENNQKPLTTGNKLFSYMKDANTVTEPTRLKFQAMVNIIEEELALKMCRLEYTYNTFTQALKVARYCDRPSDNEFVREALEWLMDHCQTNSARKWMDGKYSRDALLSAVKGKSKLPVIVGSVLA